MNEWVWSIGEMVLTGETEVLGERHYTASVVDEWMIMEHWWNGTDMGNWSTGRKTLYSVGGRWVGEYGALVEWYWQGKLKCWERNTPQCRFVHQKPSTDRPGNKSGPPRWVSSDWQLERVLLEITPSTLGIIPRISWTRPDKKLYEWHNITSRIFM
jgi:hypothetical protein